MRHFRLYKNIKLTIEYDGTNYCGWQRQNSLHKKSIQETIEKALQDILQEKVRLTASGRTDAGVHAKGQVANFKTLSLLPIDVLKRALNSLLPKDIRIKDAVQVNENFHSRFNAKAKLYRYTICNDSYCPPFDRFYTYHIRYKLNIQAMRLAAKHLTGRHNFRSFQTDSRDSHNATRTIKKLRLTKNGNLIYIDIEADGFLYNMVRSIAGTLIDVGRGNLNPFEIKKILMSRDRSFSGPTAPAHGLCLQKLLFTLFFIFFILSGCAQKENIIKIGVSAPFTGDQAKIGLDILHGVELAVEQANQKNALLGYTLMVYPLDDQRSPSQAVICAKKFVADRYVLGVIGHLNSSCTKPASSIYYEGRLVQITPASTNPDISKQGFDTFFRVCATDDVQGPAAANFAYSKLGVKTVYIIDDKTTYGKGLADEFEKQANLLGMILLGHEGITQGEKDFTPLLTKIKSLSPELIFFGGIYPEAALLIGQGRGLGIGATFLGGDGMCDKTFADLAPGASEGSFATMIGADMERLETAKEFVKTYKERFGQIGSYSAYAYDATNILLSAIQKAALKDRESVLEKVRDTKDFPGVTGITNFDERGDTTNKLIGIFKVVNGNFVYIGPAQ